MKSEWFIEFNYNTMGWGSLVLHNNNLVVMLYEARTGSAKRVDSGLELVNAIAADVWTIRSMPVDTSETGMWITAGLGWKVRLFTERGAFTNYLIHPDGNLPGTRGCIGIQESDARDLKARIEQILNKQEIIKVYVNKPKLVNAITKGVDVEIYKKAKTCKKVGVLTIGANILAAMVYNFLPIVPRIIEDAGYNADLVILPACFAFVIWSRDFLKHKLGLRIPYLL